MKKLFFFFLYCIILSALLSCQKKEQTVEYNISAGNEKQISVPVIKEKAPEKITISYLEENNYLTDYFWNISDGRSLEDQTISTYEWVGRMGPNVLFRKLEIPKESIFYQTQLRKERFSIYYQTGENDKIYQLESTFSNNEYEIKFNDIFTILSFIYDGKSYSRQERAGEQPNQNFPLVGIWGRLPHLTEYRLVDPKDCLYYMEIDREIPFWAVRKGVYLLKQTEDNVFETVSSFPEGKLKLEIKRGNEIWLRPMFSLSDEEEGLVDLLVMHRDIITIKEAEEDEEYYNYYFGD